MKLAKKTAWLFAAVLLGIAIFSMNVTPPPTTEAFSKQTVKVGARGQDVREMQGRLKFLGFYRGRVDGVFGWGSYNALKNFQYRFGLRADGVLGAKTKVKLYNATRAYRPTAKELGKAPARTVKIARHGRTHSGNDIKLMANAVYGEARGEPYVGQVAVAAVILNRTRNAAFPHTPAGVIFEPRAFTAVDDGQIYLTPNARAKKAVQDAMKGWDPTGGAIYYFNPATATSRWIWGRPQIKRIGKHIFCR